MRLKTDQLVELIESDLPAIAPAARGAASVAISDLRSRTVTASTLDPLSRSLRDLLALSGSFLKPEARALLADTDLCCVDSNYINARARLRRGRREIILFSGMLYLVQFFTDMITVSAQLAHVRPGATIEDGEGGHHEESFLFLLACQVLLTAFMEDGRYPGSLHDLLGGQQSGNVAVGVSGAILFLLMHEVGHIELGHTSLGEHSDTAHVALLEPETLDRGRREELAADDYAIDAFDPEWRPQMISSLLFLLGSYALLEAFTGNASETHPLAINRMHLLAEASGLSPEESAIANEWIGSRAAFFRQLAPRREGVGGSISAEISKVMTVEHAEAIVTLVRQRVSAEHGHLDTPPA